MPTTEKNEIYNREYRESLKKKLIEKSNFINRYNKLGSNNTGKRRLLKEIASRFKIPIIHAILLIDDDLYESWRFKQMIRNERKKIYIKYFKLERKKDFHVLLNTRCNKFHKKGENKETPFAASDVINKFGENPKCPYTGFLIDYKDGSTFHFDHIIPVHNGGDNSLNNLQLLSPIANQLKWKYSEREFLGYCKLIANCDRAKELGI